MYEVIFFKDPFRNMENILIFWRLAKSQKIMCFGLTESYKIIYVFLFGLIFKNMNIKSLKSYFF